MIRLCHSTHIWRIPAEPNMSCSFFSCLWLFPLTGFLASLDWWYWWATLWYSPHSCWQFLNHCIILPGLFVCISDIETGQNLLPTTPLLLPFLVVSLPDHERVKLSKCSATFLALADTFQVFNALSISAFIYCGCVALYRTWHDTRRCFVLKTKNLWDLCAFHNMSKTSITEISPSLLWLKENSSLPDFLIL